MADFRVIEPLANRILENTTQWSGIAGQLAGLVMAPILVGVTLIVMWHGMNIMRGAGGQHHILDVFAKMIRAILVVGLAIGAGAYTSNVVGFFQEMRSGLTGLFVTGSTTSYNALDVAMSAALSTWDPTWSWASEHITVMSTSPDFSGVVALICWFLMVAALGIFAVICAINLIVIDFALAVIFALGPIFVGCFAFQATSRFTDAWLGGVLKYTFTAVVISAVIGIGIGVLQNYTTALQSSAGALDFVTAALAAGAASGILGVLAMKIPNIAGDIVGGIGISAFGPTMASRPVAAAFDLARSGSGAAANAAAYGAGRASAGGAAAIASGGRTPGSFTDAVRGRGLNSEGFPATGLGARNAFALGRGVPRPLAGTGVISGGSRPVERMHSPGGA
jgi:type IV secretion system protein VirB6